ncbi:hypothetical protein [Cytobacillus luteolus]|nr:hypothetical protein [Cytobacillus luteolus]MBP1943761.1 H+/Cl- antiporter ClcA [Cytobacillus luteolus]
MGDDMQLAMIAVVVVLLVGLVLTISLAGKSDENYRDATKKNTMNLTLIYIITILLLLIGLVVYIKWFA